MSWSCQLVNVSLDKQVELVLVVVNTQLDNTESSHHPRPDMDNPVNSQLISLPVNATLQANVLPVHRAVQARLVNRVKMVFPAKMDIPVLMPRTLNSSNPKSRVRNARQDQPDQLALTDHQVLKA